MGSGETQFSPDSILTALPLNADAKIQEVLEICNGTRKEEGNQHFYACVCGTPGRDFILMHSHQMRTCPVSGPLHAFSLILTTNLQGRQESYLTEDRIEM